MINFEGPEKRIFLSFIPIDPTISPKSPKSDKLDKLDKSIRLIDKEKWEILLSISKCHILNYVRHQDFDAYLLSESSLFVYDDFIILKTCGITSPFKLIPQLKEVCKEIGLEINSVFYCHREFIYPEVQGFPHSNFNHEINSLSELFPLLPHIQTINLNQWVGIIYGDIMKIRGYYEISMTNIKNSEFNVKSLSFLSSYDEYYFKPCGYSLNGQRDDRYYTLHVTPELECSYVSFEMNEGRRYLYSELIEIFKPENITIIELLDNLEDNLLDNLGDLDDNLLSNSLDNSLDNLLSNLLGTWEGGGRYSVRRSEEIKMMDKLSLRINILGIKNTI